MGLKRSLYKDVCALSLFFILGLLSHILIEKFDSLTVAEKLFSLVYSQYEETFVHVVEFASVFAKVRFESIVEGSKIVDEVCPQAAQGEEAQNSDCREAQANKNAVVGQEYRAHEQR